MAEICLKKSIVFWISRLDVLVHRGQDRTDALRGNPVDLLAALQALGLVGGEVELLLDRVVVVIAADVDVAPVHRRSPVEHRDGRHRRADVHERDDVMGLEVVVRLEGVLQGEGGDVHGDRREPRLADHAAVVVDLVLLGGRQEDVHVPLAREARTFEDLVVEVHVLDVERDVLFRLPVDRLRELRLAHDGKADPLHDHRVPGERRGHLVAS